MLTEEQMELLAKEKIPVTTGGSCDSVMAGFMNNFIMCLDHSSAMPTGVEIRQLQEYRKTVVEGLYRRHEEILAMPFPAIEGHNTVIFTKGDKIWGSNGTDGWAFRRMTWNTGPTYFPTIGTNPAPPWSLENLIQHLKR